MSETFLEMVELANGDVGLRRPGEDELIVRLVFSEASMRLMGDAKLEISRVMFQAGAAAFNERLEAQAEAEAGDLPLGRVVH